MVNYYELEKLEKMTKNEKTYTVSKVFDKAVDEYKLYFFNKKDICIATVSINPEDNTTVILHGIVPKTLFHNRDNVVVSSLNAFTALQEYQEQQMIFRKLKNLFITPKVKSK